jgi:hypothetical protein
MPDEISIKEREQPTTKPKRLYAEGNPSKSFFKGIETPTQTQNQASKDNITSKG